MVIGLATRISMTRACVGATAITPLLRGPPAQSVLIMGRVRTPLRPQRLVSRFSAPKASSPQPKVLHDRWLLASMGAIGGGVVVTSAVEHHDNLTEKMKQVYYRDGDDSWSDHFAASGHSLKRQLREQMHGGSDKVVGGLIAANALVWGLWRVSPRNPRLELFMWRHFACSYDAVVRGKRIHTLFTSAFSHITLMHIGVNMFMLWEFGRHIIAPQHPANSKFGQTFAYSRTHSPLLQANEFLTLYGSSALASSALSIAASRFRGTPGVFTIGASGAVMGVLTMYCLLFPERHMMLYGVIDMTAAQLLKLTTAANVIGSAFQRGLQIDFTGHLGGQIMGLAIHEAPPMKK